MERVLKERKRGMETSRQRERGKWRHRRPRFYPWAIEKQKEEQIPAWPSPEPEAEKDTQIGLMPSPEQEAETQCGSLTVHEVEAPQPPRNNGGEQGGFQTIKLR